MSRLLTAEDKEWSAHGLSVLVCGGDHLHVCSGCLLLYSKPSCELHLQTGDRYIQTSRLCVMQYRMLKNYQDPTFIGPRVFDKVVVGFLLVTLYWGIGDDLALTNITNLGAVLFMYAIGPGFTAVSYVPALVLQRQLFLR